DVVVLSRAPRLAPWRIVSWDGVTVGDWSEEIDGADVVINLAGRSVNCRYNATNRQDILESRTRSTRAVGAAIAASARPPHTWLQASTATIYSHRYDAANDELSGVLGGDEPNIPKTWMFSIEVARAWEAAFNEVELPSTRKVALRSAIVMSPEDGGAFATLMTLARFGLGGQAGQATNTSRGLITPTSPRRCCGSSITSDWLELSTSPLRTRFRRKTSCGSCGAQQGFGSDSLPRRGCSRSARCSCAARRSSFSRAVGSCPLGSSKAAWPLTFRAGQRQLTT